MKAALTLAAVCVVVFLVGQFTGGAKDFLVELLLPKQLEQIQPAASLIVLPVDEAVDFKSSVTLAIWSFGGAFKALFTLHLITFAEQVLLVFIALLGAILHVFVFVVSLIVGAIAVAIGFFLTVLVFVGGWFA